MVCVWKGPLGDEDHLGQGPGSCLARMFPPRNPFWAFCRNNTGADLSLLHCRAAPAAMSLELPVATSVSDSLDLVFKGGAEIWPFSSGTLSGLPCPLTTHLPQDTVLGSMPKTMLMLKIWACQFSVPSAGHWTQEIPWEQAICSLPRGA